MRALLSVALWLLSFTAAQLKADYNPLLKKYADSLRYHRDAQVRLVYNDSFTRLIREIADEDNGFAEPLDSIMSTISVLQSEDGKLKVISWLVINEKEEFFNHCLVLYKAKENKPHKSFWLRDKIEPKSDSLYEDFTADFWPGALYYQMYQFKKKGRNYYCVLGLNGKNSFCNQKIIDVLWVDKEEELHIGAPVFYAFEKDYTPQYRVFFEYADQSTMLLRFEKEKKMITYSNLVPSNPEKIGMKQYYIPDGRIDYYVLKKKGKWIRYDGLKDFDFLGNE
jgi:hypothetical protein